MIHENEPAPLPSVANNTHTHTLTQAFESVGEAAVARCVHVASCVLEGCDITLLQRLLKHRASLAVFGRQHVVSGKIWGAWEKCLRRNVCVCVCVS